MLANVPTADVTEAPAAQGWWIPGATAPGADPADWRAALMDLARPVWVVEREGALAVAGDGQAQLGASAPGADALALVAHVPALLPGQLGDAAFRAAHGLRYAYVGGAMARGIASEAMVEAFARAGMLGEYGAAGLSIERVEAAIDRLQANLGALPFAVNLIHSPNEPELEDALVDLYLKKGVRAISAAAYLQLSLPLVRYRTAGLRREASGRIIAPHRILAKVSRVEVARPFMSPPPEAMLAELVQRGDLTPEQAAMARELPMAHDISAEADSGGHTDNQPALTMFPSMLALAERMQAEHGYAEAIRVGLGGGIATPAAAAAAFAMGAAYVVTGTVNQACVESGVCDHVKALLAKAGQGDVTMAPAADMFEMGVNVQVLKFGTMFAMRARKLYELYRAHASLDDMAPTVRTLLERDYFKQPLEAVWASTQAFFAERDPAQLERAARDPKHQMALVFRAYLGQASTWAVTGNPERRADYQIWCGPAIGAFNEWTRGTALAEPAARRVVPVAQHLLAGAAMTLRASQLRAQGIALPPGAGAYAPDSEAALAAWAPAAA